MDTIKTERYKVTFGHDATSACKRVTMAILEFESEGQIPSMDIRALRDPTLDACQWCDKPLTRVVGHELAHKPAAK